MDERYDYQRQMEERERRMREDDERLKQFRQFWQQWANSFNVTRSKENALDR